MTEIIFFVRKDGIFYFFSIFVAWYLTKNNINIIFRTDIKNEKNKIIIPFGIEQQEILFNSKIYRMLDNKSNFYKFINKINKTNIKLIKTYDNEYIKNNGENIKKNFIIKPNDGFGSKGIIYKEDYIYNLIKEFPNHQIQDIINNDCGYELSCVCKNGKIISNICIKTKSANRSVFSYVKGITGELCYKKDLLKFAEIILKKIKYNGFIEFEFIKEKDVIYIMECNARISGWVNNEYYYEKIILPYLNEFYNLSIQPKLNYPKNEKVIFSDFDSRVNLVYNMIFDNKKFDNILNCKDFFYDFLHNL